MRKPPRVRAASGKREYAILGRRHVPAVPKSRKWTGAAEGAGLDHRAHTSRRARPAQAPLLERSPAIAQRRNFGDPQFLPVLLPRRLAVTRLVVSQSLIFGGCSRTRTCGPLIKSQLLYQLSYAPGAGRTL